MATNTLRAALVAATLSLSACGMPHYVPAHGQSVEESARSKLECEMVSEGMTPAPSSGFYASGKPAYVAGASAGYALGLAIEAAVRQQHRVELFGDCMIAHGFRKEEPRATTQVTEAKQPE